MTTLSSDNDNGSDSSYLSFIRGVTPSSTMTRRPLSSDSGLHLTAAGVPSPAAFKNLLKLLSPPINVRALSGYLSSDSHGAAGDEADSSDFDEGCFVNTECGPGIDIVGQLPTELGLLVISQLDLAGLLMAHLVSRTWHRLACDNSVWMDLFQRSGWSIDLERAKRRYPQYISPTYNPQWYSIYRMRHILSKRWISKSYTPSVRQLEGHSDSVYCVDFDSARIITGSRDRTIKIWSAATGKLLRTLTRHHGSVLCLKFDRDWDLQSKTSGMLVSGSSDRTVIVWTVGAERDGTIEVTRCATLNGHAAGVLDLRINTQWIVSCSKDGDVCVWSRTNLQLHCTFSGHFGPVNAVGLQDNRVVSASGDGKMILWDIETKSRLRTFAAHDRGLACIAFKGDFIVSGSSDCSIKIWNVHTGECIQTLKGHDLLVRALAVNPNIGDNGVVVSASYDRSVKIWDFRTGKLLRTFGNEHNSHIFDVRLDHGKIISASHDHKVVILDFLTDLPDAYLFV